MNAYNPMNLYITNKATGAINSPAFSRKYSELLTTAGLIRKNKAKVTAGQIALSKMQAEPGSAKDTIANMAKASAKQKKVNALLEEGLDLGDKFNATLCEAAKILAGFPAQASRHVIMNASGLAAGMVLAARRFHLPFLSSTANIVIGVTSELEGVLPGAVAPKKGEIAATIPRELKDGVENMLFSIAQKTIPEGARDMFLVRLSNYLYANANFKEFEFEKSSADKSNSEVYFRVTRNELAEFVRTKVPRVGFDRMVSNTRALAVPKKTRNPLAVYFRAKKAETAKAALEMLSDISSAAYGGQ